MRKVTIFVFLAACGVFGIVGIALILPETGTPSLPTGVLATYRSLLFDRSYIGYALTGGFGNAGLFAYIAAYPFVVIDLHHVAPRAFGWWFGANAVAYIAVAQLNRLLLRRWSPAQLLSFSTAMAIVFGFGTFLVARAHLGLFPIAVFVFLFVGSLALTGPNSVALAMEGQPTRAGAASALLGTLQFTIAAGASWAVGALGERSAVPMTIVMTVCGACAFLAQWLASRANHVEP